MADELVTYEADFVKEVITGALFSIYTKVLYNVEEAQKDKKLCASTMNWLVWQ